MKTVELTEEEVDLIYWNIKRHKRAVETHLDNQEVVELCEDILLKLDDQ